MAHVPETNAGDVAFEPEYPEYVAERLGWYARELGVSEGRVLALLGLTRSGIPTQADGGVDWTWVVENHEDEASWAEWLLYDAFQAFHYDVGEMRQKIREEAEHPYLVVQPGGGRVSVNAFPAAERERILLTLIAYGGFESERALIAYLAQPGEPLGS